MVVTTTVPSSQQRSQMPAASFPVLLHEHADLNPLSFIILHNFSPDPNPGLESRAREDDGVERLSKAGRLLPIVWRASSSRLEQQPAPLARFPR